MSERAIDTAYDKDKPKKGDILVLGIRVDALPENEAERLAKDGRFYPMTLDKLGQLRAVLAEGSKVEVQELEVLRASRDLLQEIRDLLMQIP